ncbi:hypothetical protein QQF64_023530 [Cirrhinus molitorella]|uniref:Uncharacterized protein n=1 Tax=Cirrhinus molitorella TaxID=172907 RepID=A0ABR3NIL1_9TELE
MDATRGKRLQSGLVRDLNPGPLAPEARIIPLDQRAIPRLRMDGRFSKTALCKQQTGSSGFEPGPSRTLSENLPLAQRAPLSVVGGR